MVSQAINAGIPLASEAVALLSLSALCAQAWDLVVHFTDEVQYLWRGRFNFIKGLYLVARYGALLGQILDQAIPYLFVGQVQHIPAYCPWRGVYRTIFAQTLISVTETILLIRVYALHHKSPEIGRFLLAVFVSSTILEATGSGFVVRSQVHSTIGCVTPRSNRTGMATFAIGAFISHSTIFTMTISKFVTSGRAGWQRALGVPLANLLFREGILVFVFVMVLLAINMAHEDVRDVNSGAGHAMWYVALISMAASRLILNMRKLGAKNQNRRSASGTDSSSSYEQSDSDIRLTTVIVEEEPTADEVAVSLDSCTHRVRGDS
ncbi:hypothetical protein CPC08DRAFT_760473 [Agrocybe pediades]|nr:hypothetical protein CPC08DRAFT_760473 [Agrocybe pediades]